MKYILSLCLFVPYNAYPQKAMFYAHNQMPKICDIWTQKANFPGTDRRLAAGFSIGTKGYIGTGLDGEFKLLRINEKEEK